MKSSILLGLLAAVFFFSALSTVRNNTFLIDDREQIKEGIKLYSDPASLAEPDYAGRKQIAASFFLGTIHHFFGMNPFPYHAALLAVHLLVFLLVLSLASKLGLGRPGSSAAAIFFLILGIHFQAVAWIGNTTRLLMTFFMLLAIFFFDRFRGKENGLPLAAFWISWLLALQSSPDAVILPGLLLAYDTLILKKRPARRFYAAMICVVVLSICLQLFFYQGSRWLGGMAQGDFQWRKRFAGILWTLAHLVIPRREILDPFIEPIDLVRLLIPAFIFLPILWLIGGSLQNFKEDPHFRLLVFFSLAWFVIAFAPFSIIHRSAGWREYPPARYFYLPMIGLSFLVGKAAEIFLKTVRSFQPRRLRWLGWAGMALAGIYFYTLNVSTFCFMADKLDRTWRVKETVNVQAAQSSQ